MERGATQAPTPQARREEVLVVWAEQWSHEGVVVDWEKPLPPKEFVVLPRRWAVERTFVLLSHIRKIN
jgi:transposase